MKTAEDVRKEVERDIQEGRVAGIPVGSGNKIKELEVKVSEKEAYFSRFSSVEEIAYLRNVLGLCLDFQRFLRPCIETGLLHTPLIKSHLNNTGFLPSFEKNPEVHFVPVRDCGYVYPADVWLRYESGLIAEHHFPVYLRKPTMGGRTFKIENGKLEIGRSNIILNMNFSKLNLYTGLSKEVFCQQIEPITSRKLWGLIEMDLFFNGCLDSEYLNHQHKKLIYEEGELGKAITGVWLARNIKRFSLSLDEIKDYLPGSSKEVEKGVRQIQMHNPLMAVTFYASNKWDLNGFLDGSYVERFRDL